MAAKWLKLAELVRESFRSIAAHPEACEIYRNDYKYRWQTGGGPRYGDGFSAGKKLVVN